MTSRVYRFAPLLLTFALVACDGGSEDTTDDTTDDTTVDTTDTTDTTRHGFYGSGYVESFQLRFLDFRYIFL